MDPVRNLIIDFAGKYNNIELSKEFYGITRAKNF